MPGNRHHGQRLKAGNDVVGALLEENSCSGLGFASLSNVGASFTTASATPCLQTLNILQHVTSIHVFQRHAGMREACRISSRRVHDQLFCCLYMKCYKRFER